MSLHAKLVIDQDYHIGAIDKRIYGSFIEHMERVVYEGIYEPGHPLSNAEGFRMDIIDLVREMAIPIIRYPGGNFLSGYNWEDGIGPKELRPTKLDLAWIAVENNQVGTNEFMNWSKLVDCEVNMAVNLGTRGPDQARNLVEYCNYGGRSFWSDLRRSHGVADPYKIKTWCLGNEMDGHWQIGAKTAHEYGRIALEAGKLMKLTDSTIELVACGSSNDELASFPEWDAAVLDIAWPVVDLISLHKYYSIIGEDAPTFLAHGIDMNRQIKSIVAVCDYIQAKHRSKKKVMLSFDEWGIWNEEERANRSRWTHTWDQANAISEGSYTFADALLTGSIMMNLINNSDRVKMACQAQLVNHLSLINCAAGGRSWKQTIFYPFLHTSRYGRGIALRTQLESPFYETKAQGEVPLLETAVVDNADGEHLTMFILNRSMGESVVMEADLRGFAAMQPMEHICYDGYELNAKNSLDADDVVPHNRSGSVRIDGNRLTAELQSLSWNVIRLRRAV